MKSPYLDGAPIAKPGFVMTKLFASLLSKTGNQVAQVEMIQIRRGTGKSMAWALSERRTG